MNQLKDSVNKLSADLDFAKADVKTLTKERAELQE